MLTKNELSLWVSLSRDWIHKIVEARLMAKPAWKIIFETSSGKRCMFSRRIRIPSCVRLSPGPSAWTSGWTAHSSSAAQQELAKLPLRRASLTTPGREIAPDRAPLNFAHQLAKYLQEITMWCLTVSLQKNIGGLQKRPSAKHEQKNA